MIDIFHNASLQLWIQNYHIHHSFIGLVFIAIGLTTLAKSRLREPWVYVGFTFTAIGMISLLHWILFYYGECGGLLWITAGR
jgi:hypothetical protein